MNQESAALFQKIIQGDRVALARAMTLVESNREADREVAVALLEKTESRKSEIDRSVRLAISGAPGVGKSTLIEQIGLKAISDRHKVGVLTIDPSSNISQGSILGDKSRMQQLSLSESAFVRSSPAGTLLGGLGRRTKEMMTLLGAAGFDLIFVETVGVGQSEHTAWQLTDGFVLVIQPGSGDELQGIKRGITELADIIVVNKSDTSLKESAAISRGHYQNAIHYLTPLRKDWNPKVLSCSAQDGTGIDEFWENIRLYIASRLENGQLREERVRQDSFWLSWSLGITAHQTLMNHPVVNQKLSEGLLNMNKQRSSIYRTEFEIETVMKKLINTTEIQAG